MSLTRKLYDKLPDWIWPHLTGDEPSTPKDEPLLDARHASLLNEVDRVIPSRLTQADERVRNVATKLVALLTLTSVLSAAVTASLAAAATLGSVDNSMKGIAWVAIALIFYVAIQLLRSLWATVNGLVRTGYRRLSPSDICPRDSESADTYRTRLLNLQVSYMLGNEWVVDKKVSEMAVAHVALRNALTATFGLILLALVLALIRLG